MSGSDAGADSRETHPILRICPEPSEEELAVIAAAVVALSQTRATGDRDDAAPEDRWRTAARREALRSPLRPSVPWWR